MTAPKLRFKEFDGYWSDSKLGQLIGISSASRVFKEQWQTSGVPFFRTSDVVSIFKNKKNEKVYIPLELFEELSKKSGKIQKGDLLVTGGGTIGIPYLVENNEPLYFKDADLLWLKSSGIVEGSFLYNFFISPKFREYLKSISHTGTISHFTIEQAKVTPFQYPSKEEQTKIASFLSAVDEKISQLTQKHALLIQYKQGMMQKLFSQQIRFKADDGSEFGDWEEKLLSEIGFFKNGLNKDKESFGFGFPFINLMDVFGKKVVKTEKLGLVDANQKDLDNYDLKKGDVLFIRSSVKSEGVGQTALVIDDLPNTVYSGFLIRFRDSYGLDLGFKKYCFMNNDFRLKLLAKSTTSANTNINQESLSALSIKIPCLAEQTKIANFLSAIDHKIEVVAQQIEQTKVWKKGLLQQMFV